LGTEKKGEEGKEIVRRMLLVLAVALVMATLLVGEAAPAFASRRSWTWREPDSG
jgi:hypothetical protein